MTHVLTLLADPATRPLDDDTLAVARAALQSAGAAAGASDWLAPGIACDLPFSGLDAPAAEAAVRASLDGLPVDAGVQPLAGRRKRLLVADMESTIIGQEMLDELAEAVGLRAEIAAVTERAMRGELDFEDALRARVGKLAGLPLAQLEASSARMTLNPGARTLVATMKAHGAYTALVSGGFTFFTEQIQALCGFDHQQANVLAIADARLTGEVVPPILGREAKLAALEKLAGDLGVTAAAACTVGDGANDLAMLGAAGLGVAYRAKPKVREAARFRLDHADLTGLLYYQGYRQAELVIPD